MEAKSETFVAVPLRVKFTTRAPARDPTRLIVNVPVSPFSAAAASVAAMVTVGKSSSAIVSVCELSVPSAAPVGFARVTVAFSAGRPGCPG